MVWTSFIDKIILNATLNHKIKLRNKSKEYVKIVKVLTHAAKLSLIFLEI